MATKQTVEDLTAIPGEKKTRKQKSAEHKQLYDEVKKEEAQLAAKPKEQAIEGEVVSNSNMGRPSIFDQAIADEFCANIAAGESMRTACKPAHMPARATIFNWLRTNQDFLDQYTRAKVESADAMLEDIFDIADDGQNDYMETTYGDQSIYRINPEALQRSKLRVETRKWAMAKLQPKKYGDKLDLTSGGEALPTPLLGSLSRQPDEENTTNDINFIPDGAQ